MQYQYWNIRPVIKDRLLEPTAGEIICINRENGLKYSSFVNDGDMWSLRCHKTIMIPVLEGDGAI